MRIKSYHLALGAVLLASAPAVADGWTRGGGSIRQAGPTAVPVPVPVPIPDYAARWYLRADVALGLSQPTIAEDGLIYGLYDSSMPFSTPGRWSDDDVNLTFGFGAGFGYYWSPRFRTDLTFEGRTGRDLKIKGSYQYAQETYGGGVWTPTGLDVVGDTSDTANLRSGVLLFNAYYDFARGGPFTPYFGAGIGFAVNALERRFRNYESVCDPTAFPAPSCWGPMETRASDTSHTVSLAAAATAGFAYNLSATTMLDVNYRYLFIEGTTADLDIAGTSSRLSTGDIHEHQLRAGLRWNIQ